MLFKSQAGKTPSPDTGGDEGVTLEALCKAASVNGRTVRFYIINGLLEAPTGAGPAARYPSGHVARLQLVRALQEEGMQLAKIGAILERSSDTEVEHLLANLPVPGAPQALPAKPLLSDPAGRTSSARDGREGGTARRSQWDHFVLEPGVELVVRRPLTLSANRRVKLLIEYAQKLLSSPGGAGEGGEAP